MIGMLLVVATAMDVTPTPTLRADAPATLKLPWSEMHIPAGTNIRDLWKHEDFKATADQSFTIPPHGSLMFRMKAPK